MDRQVYFSGIDRALYVNLLASENASVMLSPPEVGLKPAVKNALLTMQPKVVLDSGAFQGRKDVKKYAEVILATSEFYDCDWFANLDVIGDVIASQRNYEKLLSLLPDSLHKKILWVYHGGDLKLLDEMTRHLKYVGIGGLVPDASNFLKLKQVLTEMGEVLTANDAKAHLFGLNGVKILKWTAFQDWFRSADSTAWMYGYKATEIFTANGDRVRMSRLGLMLSKEERTKNNIRVIQFFLDAKNHQNDLFSEEIA